MLDNVNTSVNEEILQTEKVPIHLKMTLTIREAAEYSNIGINKIDSLLKKPHCPFVLYVGTRKLVKRKEFEARVEYRTKAFRMSRKRILRRRIPNMESASIVPLR